LPGRHHPGTAGDGRDDLRAALPGRHHPGTAGDGRDDLRAALPGRDHPRAALHGRDHPRAALPGRDDPRTASRGRDDPRTALPGRHHPRAALPGRDDPRTAGHGRDDRRTVLPGRHPPRTRPVFLNILNRPRRVYRVAWCCRRQGQGSSFALGHVGPPQRRGGGKHRLIPSTPRRRKSVAVGELFFAALRSLGCDALGRREFTADRCPPEGTPMERRPGACEAGLVGPRPLIGRQGRGWLAGPRRSLDRRLFAMALNRGLDGVGVVEVGGCPFGCACGGFSQAGPQPSGPTPGSAPDAK
jgi:hypothetical protein